MTDETTNDVRAELDGLRATLRDQQERLAAQEHELQRLRSSLVSSPGPGGGAGADGGPTGRRQFLRLVGATAVGAAGTMVTMAPAAGAVDADPLAVGETATTSSGSTATTALDYTTAQPRSRSGNGNAIFAVIEGGVTDAVTAAIAGVAGVNVADAIGGATSAPSGFGVTGIGIDGVGTAGLSNTGIGVAGFSLASADLVALGSGVIGFVPHLPVLPPTVGSYITGDIAWDEGGNLFVCVEGGAPGSWRKLAGPSTAGAFSAIAPQRVYDSRTGPKIQTDEERTISVASSGGLPVVPAGALAVAITLTVTETDGPGGFLAVRPAGTAYAGTSSINWFGPGQNIAATVLSALGGNRGLTVRGFTPTHFIVDVTGYFG